MMPRYAWKISKKSEKSINPYGGFQKLDRAVCNQKNVSKILLWSPRKYPAKNYMVVIWGMAKDILDSTLKLNVEIFIPVRNIKPTPRYGYLVLDQMDPVNLPFGKPFGSVPLIIPTKLISIFQYQQNFRGQSATGTR